MLMTARAPERAGEEDTQLMHDDGGDEHERRPMVHLAHHQAGANLERKVQGRRVGSRDGLAVKRQVAALVRDRRGIRHVEEGEEDARRDEHHQAEQRDLAEQEARVVREDLPEARARPARQPEALVEPAQHHDSPS